MSLDDLWILVKNSPPPIECCEKYCETQIALHRLRRCSSWYLLVQSVSLWNKFNIAKYYSSVPGFSVKSHFGLLWGVRKKWIAHFWICSLICTGQTPVAASVHFEVGAYLHSNEWGGHLVSDELSWRLKVASHSAAPTKDKLLLARIFFLALLGVKVSVQYKVKIVKN